MKYIILQNKNVVLINFSVINGLIEDYITNDDILEHNMKHIDNQRIILHTYVYMLCETIRDVKCYQRKILILTNNDTFGNCVTDYYGNLKLKPIINKCISDIKKYLPLQWIEVPNNIQFDELDDDNFWKTGEGIEISNNIDNAYKRDLSKYTFEKIKKYTEKNGLTFLNDDYFTSLKPKQLLY